MCNPTGSDGPSQRVGDVSLHSDVRERAGTVFAGKGNHLEKVRIPCIGARVTKSRRPGGPYVMSGYLSTGSATERLPVSCRGTS